MQQHTGQHLLSAVMESSKLLEPYISDYKPIITVGWGMGPSVVSSLPSEEGVNATTNPNWNYVDLDRKPTEKEVEAIQEVCNDLISKGKKIWVETHDETVQKNEHVDGHTVSETEEKKWESLPEDYDPSKGVVRVINIDEVDENP
jgi:misacylated tRNA(Ala) deacylase